jgi:hypothetical protein
MHFKFYSENSCSKKLQDKDGDTRKILKWVLETRWQDVDWIHMACDRGNWLVASCDHANRHSRPYRTRDFAFNWATKLLFQNECSMELPRENILEDGKVSRRDFKFHSAPHCFHDDPFCIFTSTTTNRSSTFSVFPEVTSYHAPKLLAAPTCSNSPSRQTDLLQLFFLT